MIRYLRRAAMDAPHYSNMTVCIRWLLENSSSAASCFLLRWFLFYIHPLFYPIPAFGHRLARFHEWKQHKPKQARNRLDDSKTYDLIEITNQLACYRIKADNTAKDVTADPAVISGRTSYQADKYIHPQFQPITKQQCYDHDRCGNDPIHKIHHCCHDGAAEWKHPSCNTIKVKYYP